MHGVDLGGFGIVEKLITLAIAFILTALASQTRADYIPFNGAELAPNVVEIRVETEGVAVQLEVFIQDVPTFEALLPDDWFKSEVKDRPSQTARLLEFSKTGINIRRADGTALPATLRAIEPRTRIDRTNPFSGKRDPRTGRLFPMPPDDPRVLFVELFYSFEGEWPQVLTFNPPMDEDKVPTATISMIVFDRGVPVTNFRYLSGPATLTIDRDDPWYSRFDNPNLQRHHQSGVTTYLYVEPREVRHETLIRARDLDPWLSFELKSGDVLTVETQDYIKAQALSLFGKQNPVSMDGKTVSAQSARAEVLTLDMNGLRIVEENTEIGADEAFIGVILSFPVEQIPNEVVVNWDMFNDRIAQVPATTMDPAGPFLSGASPEDPVITWKNHLLTYENPEMKPISVPGAIKLPLITAIAGLIALSAFILAIRSKGGLRTGAVGIAVVVMTGGLLFSDVAVTKVRNPFERRPDDHISEQVLAAILKNVGVAHLETSDKARTEELRAVITEASLEPVASELDRALAVRVPTGGLARVTSVQDISLSNIEPVQTGYGFRAIATWLAVANAGHWGHSHQRTLRFRALVEVVDEAGVWKLDGITVLDVRTQ
jgi:hypothetical protein